MSGNVLEISHKLRIHKLPSKVNSKAHYKISLKVLQYFFTLLKTIIYIKKKKTNIVKRNNAVRMIRSYVLA